MTSPVVEYRGYTSPLDCHQTVPFFRSWATQSALHHQWIRHAPLQLIIRHRWDPTHHGIHDTLDSIERIILCKSATILTGEPFSLYRFTLFCFFFGYTCPGAIFSRWLLFPSSRVLIYQAYRSLAISGKQISPFCANHKRPNSFPLWEGWCGVQRGAIDLISPTF